MSSVSTYSGGVSRFFGHAVPKSINGKTFTAKFSYGGAGTMLYINKISLHGTDNAEIRKIDLEYDGGITKRQLKGLKITSDGKTIDRRTFTYHNGSGSGRDFFGYANGSTDYLMSVLDISTLQLNAARRHNETLVKSWSLKSMTDVTGVVTTFTYISKHWTPPAGSQNYRLTSVYNGIAVSKIETSDPLTGRRRTRSFTYSEPVMSVPLQFLTTDDFISLSGSKTYEDLHTGDNSYSNYTLMAEFTSSCRRPGFAAENMVIYFNKVTETVTGTDIGNAVRTDYEFDNSRCIHMLGTPSMQKSAPVALYSSSEPVSTREFSMILGGNIPYSSTGYIPSYGIPVVGPPDADNFEKIFRTKNAYSGFTERIDPAPLLVRKVSYEYRNGKYEPTETVENFYSSGRHAVLCNGRYVQSNVYKSSFGNEYSNALDIWGGIDVCYVFTQSDFMRLDSTATTRHYPDGNSRRVVTRHSYGSLLAGLSGNTISCDTLALNSLSPTPHSSLSSCGNEYFLTYSVRSEDVATPFYRSATQKGFARIPVFQRWKSGAAMSVDSIEIRQEYSSFSGISPLKSRITLLRGGEKAAVQTIKSYDYDANVTSMTDADGTNHRYTWIPGHRLLSSSTIANFNGDLTTYYTWQPHVGCTSIATPSGRGRIFSYSGGRLAAERNTAGDTVATYGYSLYADGGRNMTEKTVFGDKGGATTRVFYDGFGLPVQTLAVNGSGDGSQHVSTFMTYDALDRPLREYRPVPIDEAGAMTAHSDFASLASSFYGGDSRPFTSTAYLAAAGEKVAAVYSPGAAFADHPARMSYLCNNTTDPEFTVRRYTLFNHPMGEGVRYEGFWPGGTLDAGKSVDPDGHTMLTFTDWRGYKILERRKLSDTDFIDTYYINNVWGEPLIVIQPEAANIATRVNDMIAISSNESLARNVFVYRYDRCGRLIYSRVPGCEPVEYRYDSYGRLAFMQDGNMRSAGRAMFTVYDDASRVAVTGMCDDDAMSAGVSIPLMTAPFDNSYTFPGICNTGYLVNALEYLQNAELLTATYYDNYGFCGLELFDNLPDDPSYTYAPAKGLVTGTLTAVLGNADSNIPPIATVTFYDNEERPVRTFSTTHLADTYEQTENTYTLDGQPKTVSHKLTKNSKIYTDDYSYVYDNTGRLKTALMNVSHGSPKSIALVSNKYNSIGQLKQTETDGVSTTYTYNISGGIKVINHSLYSTQTLYYEDGDNPLYSGRISAIADHMGKRIFSYDGAGRLLSSVNTKTNFSSFPYDNEIFTAEYTYDRNSNITSIDRRGYINDSKQTKADYVDNLTLSYSGNQLYKVSDGAPEVLDVRSYDFQDGADLTKEYFYDPNGNLIEDKNRGVSGISYNVLNLPCRIAFNNNRRIETLYRADGVKLSSEMIMDNQPDGMALKTLVPGVVAEAPAAGDDAAVTSGESKSLTANVIDTKTYIGNYELTGDSLTRFNTPYGYFLHGHFYAIDYDYQGNHKESGGNYACGVAQENRYYPYGLPIRGGGNTQYTPYLFGNKEFEDRQGLNIYDFGARTYAPDICRFWQPDPKAHDYHWLSPYAYCGGDPINFIDPDGMVRYYVGMDGRIIPREEAIKMQNIGEYAAELQDNDQVVILANDGTVIDVSEMYNAGTIIGTVHNTTIDSDTQSAIPFVSFIVRGDKQGRGIFEFLSDNITGINNIEYSHFMLGQEGKQGLNYITTSHKFRGECGATFLFDSQFKYGYTIREFIHSHRDSLEPGRKDSNFKDWMWNRYKKYNPNAKPITNKIYLANSQNEKERYKVF